MIKEKILLLLLSAAIAFASCQKGDTGPAEMNGTNGTNGNSDVTTVTFNVGPTGWLCNGAVTYVYNDVTVPQITQALLDSGIILSYLHYYNSGRQIQLPYTDVNTKQAFYAQMWSGHYQFEIDNFGVSMSIPTTPYVIKLVLVPGHLRISNPDLNWNNYKAVKARFNLKD